MEMKKRDRKDRHTSNAVGGTFKLQCFRGIVGFSWRTNLHLNDGHRLLHQRSLLGSGDDIDAPRHGVQYAVPNWFVHHSFVYLLIRSLPHNQEGGNMVLLHSNLSTTHTFASQISKTTPLTSTHEHNELHVQTYPCQVFLQFWDTPIFCTSLYKHTFTGSNKGSNT